MGDGGLAYALLPAGTLLCALAIDRLWGEPPVALHPVVWIGRYLGWAGRRIVPAEPQAREEDWGAFGLGALAWSAGAAIVLVAALLAQAALVRLPWWAALPLGALLLKPLLAWRMLRDEVAAVEAALAVSLDDGRARLARLVSRDVTRLSAVEVRESAIETLAENLNDSVVAPVCWFVLLGLPGAALYRFANTADAMWGYRGRWEWAGKWAAHADDLLSWLPARITAALLMAGAPPAAWRALAAEARRTPSPNGGWPMGAMALRLGVRLGKPGVYVLHAGGRHATAADTAGALRRAGRAVAASAVLGGLLLAAGAALR
ncbi:adenosylcobinamide-phosphate synthase CbiB [uncultured Xylophilus sp.]|uniref:adenosylcobinamide-phosphate synthase CbiB n=1 Tax=uncultured Xylophilus sp. TaxID=296832 RepID=UPI0025EAA829|nr:adenosylcobinamide-phosphate synthase CbiB [uncultured Xylophilus sp.]